MSNFFQLVDRRMARHAADFCRCAGIPLPPRRRRDPWSIVKDDPNSIVPTSSLLKSLHWCEYPPQLRVSWERMPGWLVFEIEKELRYAGQLWGLVKIEVVRERACVHFLLSYKSDAERRTQGEAI